MEEKFPNDWHNIFLTLLKLNKEASIAESYRPISLIPTNRKVMRIMVAKRLRMFLEFFNLQYQSAFRKWKTTNDQILQLQDSYI